MLIKSFPIKCVDLLVMLNETKFNSLNGKKQVIIRNNRLFFEFATNSSSIKTENDLKRRAGCSVSAPPEMLITAWKAELMLKHG
jgi:hypothetical protein